MGIQKLEEGTVNLIGASQVLTDPAAVVKELLDNALDAHATIIAIEIHANTLDIIQVRDNGHGIPPEDRSLVAVANCTSKLVDFTDLKDIGGASLGFRGQALASAAELSGSLTISTKVEGEPVATALKIDRNGQVIGQERASLPVGTTVRITDFIKAQPVRRQQALKNVEKVLKKIKQMLQAYALARPHVRLSLKVLRAKNDKGNWIYAPKPNGNVEDAALKVVGSACVSQCTWTVIEERDFTLHALLPRADAEASKVSGLGSFISVDGRPVAANRGTLKQVIKIFRESLKAGASGLDNVKEPFLHLRFDCPNASYDPNVEPAKDDLLFEDPDILVSMARTLFERVYAKDRVILNADKPAPKLLEVEQESSRPTARRAESTLDEGGDFTTSLERLGGHSTLERAKDADLSPNLHQLQTPAPTSDPRPILDEAAGDTEHLRRSAFRSNMYGCDEEDLGFSNARLPTDQTEQDFEELRQARKDITVSNPWVMAKMNAAIKHPYLTQNSEGIENDHSPGREIAPISPSVDRNARVEAFVHGLPTPRPSSPSPPAGGNYPSDNVPVEGTASSCRFVGSASLPPPEAYTSPQRRQMEDFNQGAQENLRPNRQVEYNYGLAGEASDLSSGTPLHAIPEASQRPRRSPQKRFQQGQLHKPFTSPVVNDAPRERVWFDHLERVEHPRARRKERVRPSEPDALVQRGELSDSIEEPRRLSSPRRNRDMRDFVSSLDLTGVDDAASLTERRNYSSTSRSRLADADTRNLEGSNDENMNLAKGVLSARGFIPASELTAMETSFDPAYSKLIPRPPSKRRKTDDSWPLHELSSNTGGAPGIDTTDHEEFRPVTRATSRRRRTAEGSGKVHRTKSSKLPLERVPKGQGMHDVRVTLPISSPQVSRWAGKIDEDSTLLNWNEPAVDAYNAFAVAPGDDEMNRLATKIHELLINRVSDGEMVQDLGELVRTAFAAHGTREGAMGGVGKGCGDAEGNDLSHLA